jgi:uncharacterized membrane protein (DUF373 family)
MSQQETPRPQARVWIARAFTGVEDIVYIGLGLLLAGIALYLLVNGFRDFGETLWKHLSQQKDNPPQQNANPSQQNANSPQQNANPSQQNANSPQQNANPSQQNANPSQQNANLSQQNAKPIIAAKRKPIAAEGPSFSIIKLLDHVLLILLIVELLYTVQVSFREHALVPEPFLLVGLISAIRRVLILTAEFGEKQGEVDAFVMELGVLTVLILALAFSLVLLRKTGAPVTAARA